MEFIEDNFFRVMTNLHIVCKQATSPSCIVMTEDLKHRLYAACEEASDIAYMLHENFSGQFNHNPKVRRVCPNPECKHIYAYFYEDFLYCPKCGTKLVTTRDDRKESMDHDQENAGFQDAVTGERKEGSSERGV